jgi:transcription elongation factor SPT5
MRKAIDLEYTAQPLSILSAFERDSLPGMIYVEARSAQQVSEACKGLVGVYANRGVTLVPIEEMASLLQIKKQDLTVTPGTWVRIKRGKYQGDLAQVMDITENGEDVGLKFIPRIDLNPRDDASVDGRKRKKASTGISTMRPPQRFFNYEEVVKVYGRKQVSKRNQVYVFQNDTYKDGFIEKDFKLSALQLDDVNPTLDEITRFTRGQDGAENENPVDLSIIAEASRKAAISVLQPGDHVEVFEGEQAGVHGVVDSINQDVVSITAVGVDIDGQKVDVPARSVRKRFKPGDHVKVMTGQNADETGLVVSISDNVVTFLSDMSLQEVGFPCLWCYSVLTMFPFRYLCSRRIFERLLRWVPAPTLWATTSCMILFNLSKYTLC